MIIDCPGCETQVEGESLGSLEGQDADDSLWRMSLVQCARCGGPLLASQQKLEAPDGQWDWSAAEILWPPTQSWSDWDLPGTVRECLDEAQRCFKARAFSACMVMLGLALEAVSIDQGGDKAALQGGLRSLEDRGVIDHRLFEWSEALRADGNLGAQAPGRRAEAQDAKDLMDFVLASCEYVYVHSKKYAQYGARRQPPEARGQVRERPTISPPVSPPSEAAPMEDVSNGSWEPEPSGTSA